MISAQSSQPRLDDEPLPRVALAVAWLPVGGRPSAATEGAATAFSGPFAVSVMGVDAGVPAEVPVKPPAP